MAKKLARLLGSFYRVIEAVRNIVKDSFTGAETTSRIWECLARYNTYGFETTAHHS